MAPSPHITWIAVDWGTSNLRVWGMQGGSVEVRAQSNDGMGTLSRDGFGPALQNLIADWNTPDGTPIIACGMVGSRQGWVEAPYRTVPTPPLGDSFAETTCGTNPVHIIAGLKQDSPADVMRGEETQIAGFLALNPGWDGILCLPGTHTKWAEVSAGEVISFQTYMSGEMYALLCDQSVLRHSVATNDWDAAAFETAVADALSRPEKLAAALFGIRASDLLAGISPATSRARLSGLLIGAELAAARPYWLGRQIALIGGVTQSQHYAAALAAQGVPATVADAERMTLAGLTAAYRSLKDPS
ncbi:2-dehydro-3-deoxygalactonokinase [Sulfitobacter sp. TSTF-M16]|uniref:2-dehydro-3-deoxygalactonokinase n=1 Tax=Sulfitobacter aestuariivivens TaxID=2766981 RepID=A0A927D3T8_9RHOB|nr:2-dehydro-3-deoxygalactonokinase [Sulfitobacter aestuariivivens]MBD3662852.1 2-dehydro-3-deoxygalactonokinase [Sulfitobacter aestuariivivens]